MTGSPNWKPLKLLDLEFANSITAAEGLPLIYTAPFPRRLHIVLGLAVIGVNLAIYWRVWRRSWNSRPVTISIPAPSRDAARSGSGNAHWPEH